MAAALDQGDLVEVAFQIESAPMQGMAEMLAPRRAGAGVLQPFRFIALDDEDHSALSKVLASVSDQSFLGFRSGYGSLAKSH
jgi:tRNA threonylcarbamoyladenosine biosynthesis protein TsaE